MRVIQITKITKQIEEENQKAENLLENKNHYIKLLEQKIFERFNQETRIREEIGKKLLTIIDDKFNALKVEISKESRNRYESIENLKGFLENDIPKLQEFIKSEGERREEGDDAILAKVTDDTNRQISINVESKIQFKARRKIVKRLKRLFLKCLEL